MTRTELNAKVKELKELKVMAAELEAEMKAIEDVIKADMTAQGVETLLLDDCKVSYKPVTSNRFDSKGFKEKYSDLYSAFSKVTSYMRFSIA